MLKTQMIVGTTRDGRQGKMVADWFLAQVQKTQKDMQVELIDLAQWELPMFDEPVSPSFNNGNYKSEKGKAFANKIGEADAYIIVTAEYNHGYPASLKNAIDYAYYEWNKKPVGFISYGGISGGIRAVEQLRLVAAELQMVSIREAVHIPFVWDEFDQNGKPKNPERLQGSLDKMIEQLGWWGNALRVARANQNSTQNP